MFFKFRQFYAPDAPEASVKDPVSAEPPDEWVEYVDTAPPETGPTREELEKQIVDIRKELKQKDDQLASLQTGTNQTIAAGLQKVAESMKPVQQPLKSVDEPESIDYEKLNQRIWDNPAREITNLLEKQQEKKLSAIRSEVLAVHLNTSRKGLENDPELSWTLRKYGSEVDQTVASCTQETLLQNPDPFRAAARIVAGLHLQEFKADVLKEYEEKNKKPASGGNNGLFTETGGVAPVAKKKTVVLTPEMKNLMTIAEQKGLDPEKALRRYYGK